MEMSPGLVYPLSQLQLHWSYEKVIISINSLNKDSLLFEEGHTEKKKEMIIITQLCIYIDLDLHVYNSDILLGRA